MAELIKPCPFCNGEIIVNEELSQADAKRKIYYFECGNCGSNTNFYGCNREEAINRWNNRATKAELRAAVIDEFAEKLKKKITTDTVHIKPSDKKDLIDAILSDCCNCVDVVAGQIKGERLDD